MSFSTKVLLGVVVGLLAGLFFGEAAVVFQPVGDVFIGLLQMTVLPYIVVSLLYNVGRLDKGRGLLLVRYGGAVLLMLLLVGVVAIAFAPMAWPERTAGSFFRTSLTQVSQKVDLVGLYVPSNPFESLATSMVPAVVVFCLFLGASLSNEVGKEHVLTVLHVLENALIRLNKLVVRFTPIGVAAVTAHSTGTLTVEELLRMQAFLLSYTVIAFVLAFVVLPGVLAMTTPVTWRRFFRICGGTFLTIFAAGKVLIVLPQLVEHAKELLALGDVDSPEVEQDVEILLPLAYPFPSVGTLTIAIFIPFAAWYLGETLDIQQMATFLAALIPTSFIAPVSSFPFLLDLVGLPTELFELFLVSTVYTDRLRVVVSGIGLVVLTVVAVYWLHGRARIRWKEVARWVPVGLIVVVGTIFVTKLGLTKMVGSQTEGFQQFVHMSLRWPSNPPRLVDASEAEEIPATAHRLMAIKNRGFLRLGIPEDGLPFGFINAEDEPVGMDVELAHILALELGVELEVVRYPAGQATEVLHAQQVDLYGGGIPATPANAAGMMLSAPYMLQTMAFVVPVAERSDFTSVEAMSKLRDLRIGYRSPDDRAALWAEGVVAHAELVTEQSIRPYLRGETDLDAFLIPAEAGAAWTIVYPGYAVAVPLPRIVKVPTVFGLPDSDETWRHFIDQWITLQETSGVLQEVYDYWILGQGAYAGGDRWSILSDVIAPPTQDTDLETPLEFPGLKDEGSIRSPDE